MDHFTRESMKHGAIFEWLTTFSKTVDSLDGDDLPSFREFLATSIPDHFRFEEAHWFPLIRQQGDPGEIAFVQALADQHHQIMNLIRDFGQAFGTPGSTAGPACKPDLVARKQTIIRALLEHAKTEDLELSPILQKYHLPSSP